MSKPHCIHGIADFNLCCVCLRAENERLKAEVKNAWAVLTEFGVKHYHHTLVQLAARLASAANEQTPQRDCCRQFAVGLPFCENCPACEQSDPHDPT